MSNKLTKERFRKLLDSLNLNHRIGKSGDFILSLCADKDCRFDVGVIFEIKESMVHVLAIGVDFNVDKDKSSDAILFCNDWNKDNHCPKAYFDFDSNNIVAEYTIFTDVDLSDEYIKENVIKVALSASWQFFVEAAKQF